MIIDLEFNNIYRIEDLPINYNQGYFILSSKQFSDLVAADMQIIWGIILGIPKACTINVDQNNVRKLSKLYNAFVGKWELIYGTHKNF